MDKKYTGILKLGVLLLVMPLVVWGWGLRRTVDLWSNYTYVKKRLEQIPAKGLIRQSTDWADTSQGLLLPDGRLLEVMAADFRKRKIVVIGFTPFLAQEESGFALYTGELLLSGSYIPLVRSVYEMEKRYSAVKIISADFQLYRENQKDPPQLRLRLIVVQLGEKSK